jgi:hypothetical protein
MEKGKYINHSGGCDGADMCWENEGKPYGVKTISYSYYGHHQKGEHPYIMTTEELLEGWEHIKVASKSLKRKLDHIEYNPYVRNLLCRNWFQVKNVETIFAVGKFDNTAHTRTAGGTGWAVQMAIDNKKPVIFFDQPTNSWYTYTYQYNKFLQLHTEPILTENFAGIGTRELNAFGVGAIKNIYEHNFKINE